MAQSPQSPANMDAKHHSEHYEKSGVELNHVIFIDVILIKMYVQYNLLIINLTLWTLSGILYTTKGEIKNERATAVAYRSFGVK